MTDSSQPAPPGREPADPSDDEEEKEAEEEESLSFEPVPLRYRHDGWTPDRQLDFIQALAGRGAAAWRAFDAAWHGESAPAPEPEPIDDGRDEGKEGR